jgi:hypothetical protein
MEVLRSDIEFLVALARADTRSHLVHWYSELGFEQAEQAWTHDPERLARPDRWLPASNGAGSECTTTRFRGQGGSLRTTFVGCQRSRRRER